MPEKAWLEPTNDETELGGGPYITAGKRVVTQPYDFAVRTLVDQLDDGELILQDIYQRNFVWGRARSSRLVESLLLNIPLPVVYFVEEESGIHTVVDGHQRLKSIFDFVRNDFKLSGLGVLNDLNGKKFKDLDRKAQRMIMSRTLRCIIIMRESDPDIRFEVFERLNTGAVTLNAQEVRNCIYRGELNQLLRRLVESSTWLTTLRRRVRDHRMRDCELILRFFALNARLEKYRPPMKKFLNEFMRDNRNPSSTELIRLDRLFDETISKVNLVFGENAFRPWDGSNWERSINRAVFDVIMIFFVSASSREVEQNREAIPNSFRNLCVENPHFMDAISRATGDRARLFTRLREFGRAVSDLGISFDTLQRIPPEFRTASR